MIFVDTQFGMTIPEGSDVVHAVCQLSQRQQLRGCAVTPGNVVVEVLQELRPGLLPCVLEDSIEMSQCLLEDTTRGLAAILF